MSSFVSVGDLSRFAYLRQANASLKMRLSILTHETTTGLKSDVPAAANGNMDRIAQVESRLALLAAHGQNSAAAQSELGGLQAALGAISDLTRARGTELRTTPGLMAEATLDLQSRQAAQDFRAIVRLMNVDVGGRFMLSGTAVQTPPLGDPAGILQDARAQIGVPASTGDIIAAIDDWFDAPPGTGGFVDTHFRGTGDPTTTGVSPDTTVTHDLNAMDPSFRAILKGLALATIASDPGLGLDRDGKAALLGAAGDRVLGGAEALTYARSRVGMNEQRTEQAAARNAAEITALSIARSGILAADPYEAAAALTQTEANLQNLYALTARLSRLSLTEYLR